MLHAEGFHGHHRRPPFFEGWYFKIVDASGQHRYAVIPALFLSPDPSQQHAFVQVLDGDSGQTAYHRYAWQDFRNPRKTLDLQLGPNHFRLDAISLDLLT